jgi:hypothetical protein
MRINAIGFDANLAVTAETATAEHVPKCDCHLLHSNEDVLRYFENSQFFMTHEFMCASCFNLYGMGLGPEKDRDSW